MKKNIHIFLLSLIVILLTGTIAGCSALVQQEDIIENEAFAENEPLIDDAHIANEEDIVNEEKGENVVIKHETDDEITPETFSSKDDTVIETEITPQTYTGQWPSYGEDKWRIQREVNGVFETLISLPHHPGVAYANNHLYYTQPTSHGLGDFLYRFDFATGETTTVYDALARGDLPPLARPDIPEWRSIGFLEVIGENLFFSVGGHLTQGSLFSLPLSPGGEVQKVADGLNGSVRTIGDRSVVIFSDGDGCGGSGEVHTLDPRTMQLTFITEFFAGCFEGEAYIGVDSGKDRLMVADHSSFADFAPPGIPGYEEAPFLGEPGRYFSVVGISLEDPSVREEIIPESMMPAGVTHIFYDEDEDHLLLYGSEEFLFDLESSSLTHADLPDPRHAKPRRTKNMVEILAEIDVPEGYRIVLK